MTQYISKSALAAEIERMLQNEYACEISQEEMGYHCALHELKSFLDTLEVKEVDLEKEIENWWNDRYKNLMDDYKFGKYNGHYMDNSTIISIAKHFFELGLKAQKGE